MKDGGVYNMRIASLITFVAFKKTWGRLLEAWLVLTVGEDVSKFIGFHGI